MNVSGSAASEGVVVGVQIEVLWDVESTKVEGRRTGEKETSTVWWKGNVIEVTNEGSYLQSKIQYEERDGFQAQTDDVRILPMHVQVVDQGVLTQLRWRFFECSGSVSYDMDIMKGEFGNGRCAPIEGHASTTVHHNLGDLRCRVEEIERLLVSYRTVLKSISTRKRQVQDVCERMCTLIRHKLALEFQKPLPRYKARPEALEKTTLCDMSCAGPVRIHIDCTIDEFEMMCEFISKKHVGSKFVVDGKALTPRTGTLPSIFDTVEALFDSLSGLCHAIGINSATDLMAIARREIVPGAETDEAAVSLCGSFMADIEMESMPSAIFVYKDGGSVHKWTALNSEATVLWREDRELDDRTIWYRNHLQQKTLYVKNVLERLYKKDTSDSRTNLKKKTGLDSVSRDSGCFSLRFKPSQYPKDRLWSRSMIGHNCLVGQIEVEVPYVLLRGKAAVKELNVLVDHDYIVKELMRSYE